MKESRINAIFSTLYNIGVCILVFIAGAMVIRYNVPPARSLVNGFIAAEAYLKAWEDSEEDKKQGEGFRAKIAQDGEAVIAKPEVTWDKDKAYNGYTLISTGYLSSPFLADMEGKAVYRWHIPIDKAWGVNGCTNIFRLAVYFVDRAHVFANGDLLAQYADWGAPYGCGIIKVDKDSNILWVYNALVHHDSTVDAKGNLFSIVQKTITDPQSGFEGLPYPLTSDYLVKVSPEGKELERISLLDAFRDTPYQLMLFRSKGDGDDDYDFFHTNSVDVLSDADADKFPLFKAGQVLISIRALNIIAVLDFTTKKVVWAYQGYWRYQHAASFLPNGHILLLDNQGHVAGGRKHSRIIELNPATLGVEWAYIGDEANKFQTDKAGHVQRLPNGNTLVAESQHARIFEVTPEGKIVWNYKIQKKNDTDYSDAIFNATRYSEDQLPFMKKNQ